jgi:hypothetical protein
MGTRNYEKGYGCAGFHFRVFLSRRNQGVRRWDDGHMDHYSFNKERGTTRILGIISRILNCGEGV